MRGERKGGGFNLIKNLPRHKVETDLATTGVKKKNQQGKRDELLKTKLVGLCRQSQVKR